jgi:ATP-dependent DNA helicase RecQ
VYRIRQRSGFSTGLNHVVNVLTGSDSDQVRRWGHHEITTFGIGHEYARNEWGAIGRELVRLGFLAQSTGQFPTLELTPEGMSVLRERRTVTLTKPREAPKAAKPRRPGEIECDELLFEKLRLLRKRLADEQGVPPYIVFGDVTLREMAREYPESESALRGITGVGETKLRVYGDAFLDEIREHLRLNGRRPF